MAISMKSYLDQMQKRFLYRATWAPSRKMEVGRFGSFSNDKWMEEGSLADYGLDFKTSANANEGKLEFTSSDGTTISTKLSGQISEAFESLTDADAGILVEFGKENSIVFKANNVTHHQLTNKAIIVKKIVELWKQGLWEKDYLIVSEVMEAESATILVSAGASAKIELKAKADVGLQNLDIADASLNLGITKNKNIGAQVIAESNITPLYQVVGLKRKFLGKPDLEIKGMLDLDEDPFEVVTF